MNKNFKVARTDFLAWGVHCVHLCQSTLYAQDLTGNNMAACRYFSAFFLPFSVRLLISISISYVTNTTNYFASLAIFMHQGRRTQR